MKILKKRDKRINKVVVVADSVSLLVSGMSGWKVDASKVLKLLDVFLSHGRKDLATEEVFRAKVFPSI